MKIVKNKIRITPARFSKSTGRRGIIQETASITDSKPGSYPVNGFLRINMSLTPKRTAND